MILIRSLEAKAVPQLLDQTLRTAAEGSLQEGQAAVVRFMKIKS